MRSFKIFLIILVCVCAAAAQQNLKPGSPAPAFSAQSLEGTTVDLSQYRGKVVMLTFWSTRCQICHEEIPKLNKVAERHRTDNVVFLALTMENETKILPYLKKNPFNFNIVPNSFGIVLKYANMDAAGNIDMGFPSYFLIGKTGQIELRSKGWDKAEIIDSQITKLLSE
jgi:peroxiredoxin